MEAKYITYIPKVLSLKERKIKQNPSCETTIQLANELNSYGTSSSLIDAAQEAWNTSLGGVVVLHHLWTGWRVRSWVYNWMSAVVTYWLKKKSTKYKTIKPQIQKQTITAQTPPLSIYPYIKTIFVLHI